MTGPKPKLSKQQREYIGVLGGFVDNLSLARDFGVCAHTIRKFKGKASVEYIRDYKNRLCAAVKTYRTNPDSYIKDQIAELVLFPVAKEIAKDMDQEITLRPIGGYFRLYAAVFYEGIETKKEIRKEDLGIIVNELIKHIPTGQFTNEHGLGNYLVEKLSQEFYKPLPPDLKKRFDSVLATLNEREIKVLTYRFGLYDGEPRTLEEVGAVFNVKRERIRQIEAKALRKLRHDHQKHDKIKAIVDAYFRYLDFLKAPEEEHLKRKSLEAELDLLALQIGNGESIDLKEKLNLINMCKQQLENYYSPSNVEKTLKECLFIGLVQYMGSLENKLRQLNKKMISLGIDINLFEDNVKEIIELETKLSVPVSDLELSVRSSNCLKEARIKTIKDLVQKTKYEVLSYRNFGEKSLQEIEELLAQMGLSLGMKV